MYHNYGFNPSYVRSSHILWSQALAKCLSLYHITVTMPIADSGRYYQYTTKSPYCRVIASLLFYILSINLACFATNHGHYAITP